MKVEFPNLPYALDALEPHISSKTLDFHYNKHHRAYFDNLVKLVAGTDYEGKTLEEIIKLSFEKKEMPIFNNSAQVWNHDFYWKSMTNKYKEPSENLKKIIESSFESFENMIQEFKTAATTQFGSGWAWLVFDKGSKKLKIMKTGNAETPLVNNDLVPLLTIDVWEHAYYLDYQNKRVNYIDVFFAKLANWEFVEDLYLKNI